MTIHDSTVASYTLVGGHGEQDELGRVGHLLISEGKLSEHQAGQVVRHQQEHGGKFGEVAVALGFISAADLERVLAQQFAYSVLTPGEGGLDDSLYMAFTPFDPDKEKIKGLRSQLQLNWLTADNKRLLITGVDESAARDQLLGNLAIAFAQAGKRTLMLDANLRNGGLHQLFGLSNPRGVADYLAGRAQLGNLIQPVAALENLFLLSRGAEAPNPQELLSLPSLPRLLDGVESAFDVILISGADLLEAYDSQILAALIPGALCVVTERRTRLKALKAMQQRLQLAQCNLLGCIYQHAR